MTAGLEDAIDGRGSMWLVTGEAGIGKTRLLEGLAERAAANDAICLWGRCWEGGGAPSYWPWIQVLRAILEADPQVADAAATSTRAPLLAGLVPEHFPTSAPSARQDPEQARFRLYDAVTEVLREAAKRTPLLVLLEDLHVADVASISLLDFLARQIAQTPLLVVGTYRDSDAARRAVGPALEHVARRVRRMPLGRLGHADVASMLQGRDPTTIQRIFDASEGNPLFVVEVARVLGRSGGRPTLPLSEGIRTVIREHLSTVPGPTVDCLREASVLGRDVETMAVAAVAGRDVDEVEGHLADAVDAGLLVDSPPTGYRFTHFLIREVLHADLSPPRRASLHRAAADRLASQAPHPWAELFMHYRAAGPTARPLAQAAAQRAAEAAMTQLAVTDAVEYYGQAITLLPKGAAEHDVPRVELLLARARGQLIVGELEAGKASCVQAAGIARRIERPDLFALAALELGGIFIIGNVDATMVQLLEEALRRLPEGPSALRAQVMARLAAAQQPAPDLSAPVAMATEAIEMARGLDDPEALLFTLRAGVSTMMDVSSPAARRPLNEEHIALATALDDRVEALRGHQRLTIDTVELGDMPAHRASARAADLIAESLDHPFYQWRTALLLAAEAAASGRFAEADDHDARAHGLAKQANDPSAELSLAMHAVGVALVREDDERVRARLPGLVEAFHQVQLDSAFGHLIVAGALARMEDTTDPRGAVVERDLQVALEFQDLGSLLMIAEVAFLQRDRALAARIEPAVRSRPQTLVSWGLVGAVYDGPAARAVALVAAALGMVAEGVQALEEALRVAERAGLEPARARILYDLGRLTGKPDYFSSARKVAQVLAMPGLLRRIDRRLTVETSLTPVTPPEEPTLRMRLEAGVWVVDTPRGQFHLKRTKGADILATLIENPGREHHVLDLVTRGHQATDAGTSGPALDSSARDAYRRRLEELETAIDESESWADTGRAERLKAERDALAAELTRAFGLGGRSRSQTSASERARVNVQRRLKDTIRRIEAYDPETGKWLERSVITGTYCRFDPP